MSETTSRRIWNPAIDENTVQEKQDRIIGESDEKVSNSPIQVWINYEFYFQSGLYLDSFPTDAITDVPLRESVPKIPTLLDASNQSRSSGPLCQIHATNIAIQSPFNKTVYYGPSSTKCKRTAGGD